MTVLSSRGFPSASNCIVTGVGVVAGAASMSDSSQVTSISNTAPA